MQFNQGNHNHNENAEYHYYGDYVQREETHVHMHGEAWTKQGREYMIFQHYTAYESSCL